MLAISNYLHNTDAGDILETSEIEDFSYMLSYPNSSFINSMTIKRYCSIDLFKMEFEGRKLVWIFAGVCSTEPVLIGMVSEALQKLGGTKTED
ncbi:hypothetical protein [Hymenobacter elongatus]|uniref:Uncharacterized protein n=1 Tax=Hymenobacter elongatus TaxID=877208 RepID=A0A4Z0PN10_9BACT|nr:hypothetical protein [Hymenobacter elongatus]TGE16410.1 hypothetical protein E5J99_09805 [Hymenobacter elongatus]